MAKTQKPKVETKTTDKPQAPSLIAPNQTIKLTFKWSEIKPTREKVESKLAKQIKLDGFRKGKVPAHIAKEHLNPEAIIESTLEQLLPPAFTKAAKDLKDQPIASPEYQVKSVEEGKDWVVEAVYATQPEIKLGQYQKITKKAAKSARAEHKKQIKVQEKNQAKDKKTDKIHTEIPKDAILNTIYKELVTTIKPKIPELLVKRETQYEIERLSSKLKEHNLTLQDYIARTKLSAEQLSNELAAEALSRLQFTFILQAVAKDAKLEVKEEEIKQQIKKQSTDPQQLINPRLVEYLRESIMRQKIADHLLSLEKK